MDGWILPSGLAKVGGGSDTSMATGSSLELKILIHCLFVYPCTNLCSFDTFRQFLNKENRSNI